ncbi:unnamed protein product [Closterium sp. NIES-64]|nr:unnamed protein product [Closterium sp. NIES-64]
MGAGKSSLVLRFVKGQSSSTRQATLTRLCSRACLVPTIPTHHLTPILSFRPPCPSPQESTIGAAFLTQTVAVSDAVVKFEIWGHGRAGALPQPRAHVLPRGRGRHYRLRYYQHREAAGPCMSPLCCSVLVHHQISHHPFLKLYPSSPLSLRALHTPPSGNPNLVIALAANKTDLEAQRKVSEEVSVRGKGRGRGTRESGFWMGCSG